MTRRMPFLTTNELGIATGR